MRTSLTLLAVALLASVVVAGCEKKEEYTFFPTYPVVGWNELANQPGVDISDNYRLLTNGATSGVFPTSLAVARLAARRGADDRAALVLDMSPEVDFLDWNSNFDDFRAVSEVFPLNRMAMDGAPVNIRTLLTNAAALRAGMLLVYSEQREAPQRYQLRGVLYDVSTRRALASVHTATYVQDPVQPDEQYDSDASVEHLAERDPRLIATQRFDRLARECLLALMADDEPADPVAPEGWIPARPMEPMFWPPIDDLGRRRDPRRFP